MAVNMQVNLGGLLMKNPVTTASGTFASGQSMLILLMLVHLGQLPPKVSRLTDGLETTLQELPKPLLEC